VKRRSGRAKLPFLSHLRELRLRVIRLLIIFVMFFSSAFVLSERLVTFIVSTLPQLTIATLSPPDYILAKLSLSLWSSVLAVVPFALIELYLFSKPGLMKSEVRALGKLIVPVTLLFYAGVSFGVLFIVPLLLKLLAALTPATISNIWSISRIVRFYCNIALVLGLLFEFPVAAMTLSKLGMVSRSSLAAKRRYVYVGLFLFAALVTPPDVFSQILFAVPLVLMYELTLLALRFSRAQH